MDPRERLRDNETPMHTEDRGSKNSRTDAAREATARARAAGSAPVPGLQAGDTVAPRRTGDLARARGAAQRTSRAVGTAGATRAGGEDSQITAPISHRGTSGQGRGGQSGVSGNPGRGQGSSSSQTGNRGGGQRNRG